MLYDYENRLNRLKDNNQEPLKPLLNLLDEYAIQEIVELFENLIKNSIFKNLNINLPYEKLLKIG